MTDNITTAARALAAELRTATYPNEIMSTVDSGGEYACLSINFHALADTIDGLVARVEALEEELMCSDFCPCAT